MNINIKLLIINCYILESLSLELLNQWNFLNYDLPPQFNIKDFSPENTVPTGIEITDGRIFIMTPRLRDGVPATVSTIPVNAPRGSSPILKAYPDWSFHGAAMGNYNCSGLISVYRAKLDSCNRLWVLDAGTVNSIDNYMQVCPPKMLIFDIRSDQVLRTITFPDEVIRPISVFTNFIIDENAQSQCDSAFVYISDSVAPGLVVYDAQNDKSWRFSDPTMFPNPDYANINIAGESFSFMDGIIGLAHSPQLATLFYQPLASDRIFSVPIAALRKGPPEEFEQLPITVTGRKSSQGLSLAMNLKDNTLYFSPFSETSVASWNAATNQQELLANDPVRLQFVAEIRWKPDGNVYVLSSRFHKFFRRNVTPNEINLRIMKIVPRTLGFSNLVPHYYYQ